MNVTTTRTEKYGLVRLSSYKLDDAVTKAISDSIGQLSATARNIILEVGEIESSCEAAYKLMVRVTRELAERNGTFILATRSSVLLDELEEFTEEGEIDVVPTVEEAIDAVYFHEIEQDLKAEDEE